VLPLLKSFSPTKAVDSGDNHSAVLRAQQLIFGKARAIRFTVNSGTQITHGARRATTGKITVILREKGIEREPLWSIGLTTSNTKPPGRRATPDRAAESVVRMQTCHRQVATFL